MKVLYFKDMWIFEDVEETRMYGRYILCNIEDLKIESININVTSCQIITYHFDTKKQVEDYMLGLIDTIKLEETTRLAYMTIRNQYHNQAHYHTVRFNQHEPHIT